MTDKSEEESFCFKTAERSFDCAREAATSEPLVRGQQFITPDGVGIEGIVNNCNRADSDACFAARCLALQQPFAGIDIEPIGWDIRTDSPASFAATRA